MNYKEAWTTLNDIIVKIISRKYSMLNKIETVSVANDPSTILAQIDMLYFIYTVMIGIENYAHVCDNVGCKAVTIEEGEKCVD